MISGRGEGGGEGCVESAGVFGELGARKDGGGIESDIVEDGGSSRVLWLDKLLRNPIRTRCEMGCVPATPPTKQVDPARR